MPQQKQNFPKLRFPEFSGEWAEKKLGELLEFKNGINANKEQYGKGVKFINVLDILNNDFLTHDKIIGCVDVDMDMVNKYPVEYGDILFQRSSETREEVGSATVYLDSEKKATFGGFVIRGKKIGNYEPVFLNKLLKTDLARDEITSKSGGSTRFNVGQETLSSVVLLFPNLKEQEKIAAFLTAVDELIAKLQEKQRLLTEYKTGVMQQIFEQKIRFTDDNGKPYPAWEDNILGEVCTISKGEQLNKSELTLAGDYPALNGGISPSGYTDVYNTYENTITISEGGNSCGYVNYVKQKFWCGGHCYALLNLSSAVANLFLYQVLKYKQNEIMALRVGSGLPNIQKKDLNNFKIQMPSLKEQEKIADFLSTIDAEIEAVAEQIEQAQAYKKGLLQQMFV